MAVRGVTSSKGNGAAAGTGTPKAQPEGSRRSRSPERLWNRPFPFRPSTPPQAAVTCRAPSRSARGWQKSVKTGRETVRFGDVCGRTEVYLHYCALTFRMGLIQAIPIPPGRTSPLLGRNRRGRKNSVVGDLRSAMAMGMGRQWSMTETLAAIGVSPALGRHGDQWVCAPARVATARAGRLLVLETTAERIGYRPPCSR